MGNEAWGIAKIHQCPMPNAQCPKSAGAHPSHPQGDGVSRRLPIKFGIPHSLAGYVPFYVPLWSKINFVEVQQLFSRKLS
jgi:hypothetical protein